MPSSLSGLSPSALGSRGFCRAHLRSPAALQPHFPHWGTFRLLLGSRRLAGSLSAHTVCLFGRRRVAHSMPLGWPGSQGREQRLPGCPLAGTSSRSVHPGAGVEAHTPAASASLSLPWAQFSPRCGVPVQWVNSHPLSFKKTFSLIYLSALVLVCALHFRLRVSNRGIHRDSWHLRS